MVNDSSLEHTVDRCGDRHAVAGITVQKVCSAVQWIHHPDQAIATQGGVQLFPDDLSAGNSLREHLANDPLGGAINLGDVIPAAFSRPLGGAIRPSSAPYIAASLDGRRLRPMQ